MLHILVRMRSLVLHCQKHPLFPRDFIAFLVEINVKKNSFLILALGLTYSLFFNLKYGNWKKCKYKGKLKK
jgi:hypothetical protein